jgi:hypothetical protein
MTFPWARIILMLIVVGLCSIFLINSRVLVLTSTSFATPTAYSYSYNVDTQLDDRINDQPISSAIVDIILSLVGSVDTSVDSAITRPIDSHVDANNLTALTDTLIDVNRTLLGYVGDASSQNSVSKQSNPNDIHYVPTYSARYISIAQHQSDESKPNYLLVYEFISPPVPSLTIGYQINFSPQLDWVLSTASAPSRLSAWKESNLLFVHAHTC